MTLSYRTFYPFDGRQAGLWYLPACWRYTTAMIEAKMTMVLCIHNVVVLFNVFKKFKRSKNYLQIRDLRT